MKKEPAVSRISAKQTVFQIIKFTFFFIFSGIIQAGSFTLLHEFARLPYWPAYLIGVVLSVLFNFTVNRRFTFKAANNIPVAMLKVAAYYVVFIPLSTWWGDALTQGAGWNEYLVLGGTMLVNLSTEYLFSRFVVYRGAMNTNQAAQKQQEKAQDTQEEKGKNLI